VRELYFKLYFNLSLRLVQSCVVKVFMCLHMFDALCFFCIWWLPVGVINNSYTAATVYLQHGGSIYCAQNDVAVTAVQGANLSGAGVWRNSVGKEIAKQHGTVCGANLLKHVSNYIADGSTEHTCRV